MPEFVEAVVVAVARSVFGVVVVVAVAVSVFDVEVDVVVVVAVSVFDVVLVGVGVGVEPAVENDFINRTVWPETIAVTVKVNVVPVGRVFISSYAMLVAGLKPHGHCQSFVAFV